MLDEKTAGPSVESLPGEAQSSSGFDTEFPVVGLGASAGGLEALTQFLHALPADTGMGFVIVQHLAPTRASSLVEILSRATEMRVCEVSEDCGESAVVPNHVYVIPPGRDLIIKERKLSLLPRQKAPLHRGIDQFFRSLAADCRHKAIGVVLSGFLSDGTLGLEEIKAEGGVTFAQDESARQGSMPRAAEASGCVDFVLSPKEIAREIARIAKHPYLVPDAAAAEEDAKSPSHERIAQIAQIVRQKTGVDFSCYKVNTLHRRIARRMLLHKLDTVAEYEAYLIKVPEEVESLFQDILINVTSFFRDPHAFEELAANIFPKLLIGRNSKEPLRIWTLGCSTGEEAYSLAIVFTEVAEAIGSQVPLQVFATDLNHVGVGKARTGLYSKSIAEVVSAARLRRFFTEEEGGYRINKAIRERCVFSRHNVLDDPPFSRVDLISCRNLLIYMEPILQQQVMPLLHYALKPGGFLWLGSSETAGTSRAFFELEDGRNKIYARRPGNSPPGSNFWPKTMGAVAGSPFSPQIVGPRELPRGSDLQKEAERLLLTKYAPPGVVISASMEIVQFRGDTGAYLSPAAGAASLNLLKMLREGLMVGVRAAIVRCGETGRAVREAGLRVKGETGFRELAVDVIPIKSGAAKERGYLVLFDEGTAIAPESKEIPADPGTDELSRLTQELAATREYLQSVIEQQETINAELQSANEEAQSSNEEMQSVNEELETSKEEIQSSNEELATVNDELNHRNIELSTLNQSLRLARDYAESIVASVRSPLVVLDAALRVKTASVVFYETFLVTPQKTEGRLIYDLGNGQWNIPALRTLLEELLPREEHIDNFEVRHSFEQIGPRIMLLNARRLAPASESEALIVLGIEDITGRRALEDSLVKRASDLARADRSKDEFLAMLAHELRNPLAPMRHAAQILNSQEASNEDSAEARAILSRQIENMSRIVDDLLDVSRITEGKIVVNKQLVALDSIFTASASLVRPLIAASGQTLTITQPDEQVFLNGDATRLDQVFGNLLSNACKYSDSGCHITLSAERSVVSGTEPPEVIISVQDNGIGIAAEMLPRIFDLFVQASNSLDRSRGGLGIGLTLVQRLVRLHNGTVTAHSDGPGKGSEFIVRLPILPSVAAPPPPPPAVKGPPRRILIVDDNQDSARSMSTLQRMRGHEVRTVFTGPDGVSAAAEFLPEVVLLDIGLPGMDGYEVARRLRAMPALDGAFLIAMTGYGSLDDRARAKDAGFDEYLVKPVDLSLLRTWLRDGLERKPQ